MKRFFKKDELKLPYEPVDQSKPSIHPGDFKLTEEDFEWARRLLKKLGEEPRSK